MLCCRKIEGWEKKWNLKKNQNKQNTTKTNNNSQTNQAHNLVQLQKKVLKLQRHNVPTISGFLCSQIRGSQEPLVGVSITEETDDPVLIYAKITLPACPTEGSLLGM